MNPYWWFWKVQLTSNLCLLRFLISSQRPMFNISKFLKGVSGFSWMKLSCCSTRKDSKHFKKNTSRKPDRRTILTYIWEFQFSNWIFQLLSWMFQVGISYFNLLLKFRFEKKKRWSLSSRVDNKATIKIFKSQGFVSIVCFCMLFKTTPFCLTYYKTWIGLHTCICFEKSHLNEHF